MNRQGIDVEEELFRVWTIVGELSEQLSNNRALVTQLKARAANVNGQAVHVGTGFPLRRFNVDISNEKFQSELEAFSSHLVLENQQLQHENKQLNALLKEYEQTLENVMSKFRGVAHSSQQHDLSLHSYYTSLLQTLQTAHSSSHLHDATSLSLLLNRLSTLLRSALRSLQGEEPDSEFDLAALLPETARLLSLEDKADKSQYPDTCGNPPSSSIPSQSTARMIQRPPHKPTRFPGFLPGTSGGYAGTEGQADWALEREMEIQRLEEENMALREMLGIAKEATYSDVSQDSAEGDSSKRVDSSPEQSRKGSLTVEELEADAAQEALDLAERASRGFDELHGDEMDHEIEEQGHKRSLLSPSMLGFETDMPPPEQAIVDELDGDEIAPIQGTR